MDYGHDKCKMNIESDRLSNLPDDLIHKILACVGIKQAIETSALSSRWRYIWTSMPFLNFSSNDFDTLPKFSKFVTHVLSKRNNQIEVSSVKLTFRGKASQVFVKRILDYAFSHNVQRLHITCLHGKKTEFPASLFSSLSLKHLILIGYYSEHSILNPLTWKLPALTTLDLRHIKFCCDNTNDMFAGLSSNFANLKNLVLYNCRMTGYGFNICHPGLSSLKLESGLPMEVKVVAPQLKNLAIKYWRARFSISAPNLSSFYYKAKYDPLELSADFLHLKKVDICIPSPCINKEHSHMFVYLLQQLHSVRFLTFNSEIITVLSSHVELISHLSSPFTNLESLKIYPCDVPFEEKNQPKFTMATEVRNYLLDSSPNATFTLVSHQDIRAAMNAASARDLMTELEEVLDELKVNSETDTTDLDQDKAPSVDEQVEVENQPDTKMKWHFGERMTHIENYWKYLNEALTKRRENTSRIIEIVREIEEKLTKLPTSQRDRLQARFSGLCAEAETVMDSIMDRMKIQFDKKPIRSNFSSHELATTCQPSS